MGSTPDIVFVVSFIICTLIIAIGVMSLFLYISNRQFKKEAKKYEDYKKTLEKAGIKVDPEKLPKNGKSYDH